MIVLSLVLVITAAVLLIVGWFQDGLDLIYGSIAACVVAMIFLGVGVLQRRRAKPASEPSGYGPGTSTTPVRPSGSARPAARVEADEDEDVRLIRSGQGRGATEDTQETPTAEGDVVVRKSSASVAPKKKAVRKKAVAKKASASAQTSKKTAKKASTKKAAKKAAKKSSKKTAKKATATTGAAARQRLAEIKGIGPAKQDALLEKFGSLEAIRDATKEELSEVPGIGAATAETIKSGLS